MKDRAGIIVVAGVFFCLAVTAYAILQLLFPSLPWPAWFPQ